MKNKKDIKYFRLIIMAAIILYYSFAAFFHYATDFTDPLTIGQRIFGSLIFLLILGLSYISQWVKEEISYLTIAATILVIFQMIYVGINTNFSTIIALSIMTIVILMNLIFNGERYVLIGNLIIILVLGISLSFANPTIKYSLTYFFAYLLATSLSYFVSYNRFNYQEHIENEKRKYEKLFKNMPIAIAHHRLIYNDNDEVVDCNFIDFNKAFEVITGTNKENIVGKNLSSVLGYDVLKESRLLNVFSNVADTGKSVTIEEFIKPLNKWINLTVYSEKPGYFKTIFYDITEEKNTKEELKNSEQRYRKIFKSAPIGLVIEDDQGNIIEVNNNFCEMSGYSKEELENSNVIDRLALPEHRTLAEENIKRIINGEDLEFDIKSLKKNGEVFYNHIKETRFILPERTKGIISMHLDITNRKKQAEEIEYLLYRDVLTGLFNRRFFEIELKRLDSKRQLPISIIMADVNGLKMINDSFGHEKGDDLLKKAAEILKKSLREEDILARQGGDEFAILLPQTPQKEAQAIVNRIKEQCELTTIDGLEISICFGIGTKNESSQTLMETLKIADDAMYQTKLLESRSTKSRIIESLLTTLSVKSYETKEHGIRMANLATKLGKKLRLSNGELNRLSLLATLHDIGKSTIAEDILIKPTQLNDEEWQLIKKHPEQGYNIASASPEFALVAEEILSHHERWDGKGYPREIKGEEIPYLARIISIIDSYDVMVMGRPYNKLLSKEEALKEIERCSGSQFDPELTIEFIKLMRNN